MSGFLILMGMCLGLLLGAFISKTNKEIQKQKEEDKRNQEYDLRKKISMYVEQALGDLNKLQQEKWNIHHERLLRLERPDLFLKDPVSYETTPVTNLNQATCGGYVHTQKTSNLPF